MKALREKNGLSQVKVSQKLGVTQSYYSKVERGERKPSLEVINGLIKILGEEALQQFIQ